MTSSNDTICIAKSSEDIMADFRKERGLVATASAPVDFSNVGKETPDELTEEAKAILASAEFEDDEGEGAEYEGDMLSPRVRDLLAEIENTVGDLWDDNTKRDVEHMLSLVVARGYYGNPAMTLPKLTIHEALTQALGGDPLKPGCIYQMNQYLRKEINELLAMSMDDLRNKEGDEFAARNK